MSQDIKTFSLGACLSLMTGRLLCDFADMHQLAEWIAGHPIWTHEFAERHLWTALKENLLRQHPQLQPIIADDVTKENWRERLDGWESVFGKTLEVRQGTSVRSETPLESAKRIMPDAKIITVKEKR